MVLKPLTAAELAVLAAGPPAQRPDDLGPDPPSQLLTKAHRGSEV